MPNKRKISESLWSFSEGKVVPLQVLKVTKDMDSKQKISDILNSITFGKHILDLVFFKLRLIYLLDYV